MLAAVQEGREPAAVVLVLSKRISLQHGFESPARAGLVSDLGEVVEAAPDLPFGSGERHRPDD